MIVLKDCPNCGSFDIVVLEAPSGELTGDCRACGCTWFEGLEDFHVIHPTPDDLPDDINAWLLGNHR